jgi:hypothetical protein
MTRVYPVRSIGDDPTIQIEFLTARVASGTTIRELVPEVEARSEMSSQTPCVGYKDKTLPY